MIKYEFPTAFSCWGDEEEEAAIRVWESGNFTMGAEVEAFEHEFAAYHGMRHAVMVNSGSSANLISVATLSELEYRQPLKRSATAVVPALAWSTTYAPLIQYGHNLHILDCDDTWNVPPSNHSIDAELIIGCSILGNPAYLQQWKEFAGVHDAYFIEDNCESLGASVDGKRCGTFGIMNTFSFFYSHQLSAIEGGMILTNDEECWHLCRMLRNHGWTKGVLPPTSFETEYDFRLFGYNVRPLEMHAAVGREQLKKLDNFVEARTKNWQLFHRMTDDLPIQHQKITDGATISPFGLSFTVRSSEIRSRLAYALRLQGIDCRLPTGGSFTKHVYGSKWRYDFNTACADAIHGVGMFLGNAPFDISDKIEKAVAVMKEVLE